MMRTSSGADGSCVDCVLGWGDLEVDGDDNRDNEHGDEDVGAGTDDVLDHSNFGGDDNRDDL